MLNSYYACTRQMKKKCLEAFIFVPLTISLLCSYVPRVLLAANGVSQCRTEGPINLIRPREALVSGKSSNPVPHNKYKSEITS